MPIQNYRGASNLGGDWGITSLQNDTILNRATIVQTIRTRFTTAEVNAGATLLPAVPGYKYRMVDAYLIAIGGNAATATSVDVYGTLSTSRNLITAAVAGLSRSAVARAGATNIAVLADGASFTDNDANTAITVGVSGDPLATATHIDVCVSYVLEVA